MKKYIVSVIGIALGLGFYTLALAETPDSPRPQVEINHEGRVLVRGAVVTSTATSSINATLSWPNGAKIDWVINTSGSELVNNSGHKATASEIQNGHVISFNGELTGASGAALAVKARVVRNWSVQKQNINPFGVIQSINSAAKSFVFKTDKQGSPTVSVSDATVITKGKATTTFATLKVGDLAHVRGLWDRTANTVRADQIKIFVENRQTFENGRLKTLPGASKPTSMVVTFRNIDYTVNLDVDTAVVNKNWGNANLSAFKAGEHIRVYGVADGTTIEATVVRNMSVKP